MSLDLISVVSENVNREEPSAQCIYFCDWEERLERATELIGGLIYHESGNASFQLPTEYPLAKGIYVSNVEIVPYGDFNDGGGEDYKTAKLTVDFAGLRIIDSSAVDGIGLCEVGMQASGEELALPNGSFYWSSDSSALDESDFKPSKTFPYTEISLVFKYGADPNIYTAADLVGHLNQDNFVISGSNYGGTITWGGSFSPGMVMFMGQTIEKTTNCQGMPQFIRDMKFGIRPNFNKPYDGVQGWNALYRPDKGKYEWIQTKDGKPLYEMGDLTKLFNIKNEEG